MGYESGSKKIQRFSRTIYNPSSEMLQNKVIGICDHNAEKNEKKYYKLPFNSPATQNFSSDIILSDIENTILNKKIYFFYKDIE